MSRGTSLDHFSGSIELKSSTMRYIFASASLLIYAGVFSVAALACVKDSDCLSIICPYPQALCEPGWCQTNGTCHSPICGSKDHYCPVRPLSDHGLTLDAGS